MTPSTVPSRPISGLTEPIVANHGRKRAILSRSSDASESSSRCSVSICGAAQRRRDEGASTATRAWRASSIC